MRYLNVCLLLASVALVCEGASLVPWELPLLPLLRPQSLPNLPLPPVPTLLSPHADLLKDIKLRLYGRSLDDFAEFLLESEADGLPRDARYNRGKPTVIYFHGYQEDADSESVRTVISAFLAQGRYNVVFVDWSTVAAQLYAIPASLVPQVGKLVARQLDAWQQSRALLIHNVYVVGHSLGAQAAGFTGKQVTKGKIPRITALDPAREDFEDESATSTHVAPTDALFVDVIHTDGGLYGVEYPCGHVDFYPNGGKRAQPGCPTIALPTSDDDFCSHWRSWRFFAESLNPSLTSYHAVACDNHDDFLAGKCSGNKRAVMGFNTPSSTRGTFYLGTSSASPFSRGQYGLQPSIPGVKSK